MTSVTYLNGYVGQYDETIKVGDLISTYNSGYHIVTSIEDRPNATPLFHYTKMFTDDGEKSKRFKSKCDGSFVSRAEIRLQSDINNSRARILALEEILKSVNTTNNQI